MLKPERCECFATYPLDSTDSVKSLFWLGLMGTWSTRMPTIPSGGKEAVVFVNNVSFACFAPLDTSPSIGGNGKGFAQFSNRGHSPYFRYNLSLICPRLYRKFGTYLRFKN